MKIKKLIVEDNTGKKFFPVIEISKWTNAPAIRFETATGFSTPAWSLKDIRKHTSDALYIDMGANWYFVNFNNFVTKLNAFLES